MDRIEVLDSKLRQLNTYELMMNKIVKGICIVAMMFFVFFSVSMPKNQVLFWISLGLMLKALSDMSLTPYLYIYKDKKKISIFRCLKETGISRKDFIKSRVKYHFSFIGKISVVAVIVCLTGGIVMEELTIKSAITSLGVIVLCVTLVSVYTVMYIYYMTKD